MALPALLAPLRRRRRQRVARVHGVKIEAQFVVGEYDILIRVARQESGGLETRLREHKYRIPEGAAGGASRLTCAAR